jgi:uncharacterized surface protein with fasciclin (FAS1) repeats
MTKLVAAIFTASVLAIAAFAAAGTSAAAPTQEPTAQKNIVQTAVAAGQFKTLVMLAKRAGLAGALTGRTKLTVFAPTDAAFKMVPKATLNKLLRNRAQLRRVLLYHVVAGDVKAAHVVGLRSAKTRRAVRANQDPWRNVFLNGSTRVVKTDIAASNGTIHVINKVFLPPHALEPRSRVTGNGRPSGCPSLQTPH